MGFIFCRKKGAAHTVLGENISHMELNRAFANRQGDGNFFIGFTDKDEQPQLFKWPFHGWQLDNDIKTYYISELDDEKRILCYQNCSHNFSSNSYFSSVSTESLHTLFFPGEITSNSFKGPLVVMLNPFSA